MTNHHHSHQILPMTDRAYREVARWLSYQFSCLEMDLNCDLSRRSIEDILLNFSVSAAAWDNDQKNDEGLIEIPLGILHGSEHDLERFLTTTIFDWLPLGGHLDRFLREHGENFYPISSQLISSNEAWMPKTPWNRARRKNLMTYFEKCKK